MRLISLAFWLGFGCSTSLWLFVRLFRVALRAAGGKP